MENGQMPKECTCKKTTHKKTANANKGKIVGGGEGKVATSVNVVNW